MIRVDDTWDVVVDSAGLLYAPVRALAVRLDVDRDLLWPLLRGLGPTPLPRPQRIYGRISTPIDASAFGSSWEDTVAAFPGRCPGPRARRTAACRSGTRSWGVRRE
jgi:hypothetical protein